MSHRGDYRAGIDALLQMQKKLGQRPKRHHIPKLVDQIVKESDMKDDPREHYFRLLVTCALLRKEPMYNGFKPLPKKRRHSGTVSSHRSNDGLAEQKGCSYTARRSDVCSRREGEVD